MIMAKAFTFLYEKVKGWWGRGGGGGGSGVLNELTMPLFKFCPSRSKLRSAAMSHSRSLEVF